MSTTVVVHELYLRLARAESLTVADRNHFFSLAARVMRQILIDGRDAIQTELARGASEDQTAAAVKLPQYEKMANYAAQRETTVRRMYKDLTGKLP